MTTSLIHKLHDGELFVQQRRQVPEDVAKVMPLYIQQRMSLEHAEFFAKLPYLPLGTLDALGRPWVSIVATKSESQANVGIKVTGANSLTLQANVSQYDPFVKSALRATDNTKQLAFAGVGIDFSNRRRNKLGGHIAHAELQHNILSLQLSTNEHLGNCPKYITVRQLTPCSRTPTLVVDAFEQLNSPLPESAKALIDQTSTVFLATKHSDQNGTSMDVNHRGGLPGFVRLYECNENGNVITYVVLPDYSGNRFYQSLGNIHENSAVGIVLPNFATGDLLFLTGNADNLYDDDAQELMPRTNLVTRIRVTGAVFIQQGLHLKMQGQEQLSPYNPPIRYLKHELLQQGSAAKGFVAQSNTVAAQLIDRHDHSRSLSTFTFKLSKPVQASLPGGFAIFDFADALHLGYNHMSETNPQLVNDDGVRTWTISSAPTFDFARKQFASVDEISITVKHKPGGLISSFLHTSENAKPGKLKGVMKGTGESFSCFTMSPSQIPSIPQKMLWIAGGAGITPFMAMWEGIANVNRSLPADHLPLSSDITLFMSARDDDIAILRQFLTARNITNISLKIVAFQSMTTAYSVTQKHHALLTQSDPDKHLTIHQRRIEETDFAAVTDLAQREVYMCGPQALTNFAASCVHQLTHKDKVIHEESFHF